MTEVILEPVVQRFLIEALCQHSCVRLSHIGGQQLPLAELIENLQPVVLAVRPQCMVEGNIDLGCTIQRFKFWECITAVGDQTFGLLVFGLIAVLVFLITRAFWCWYWKISARLEEQQKTNLYLEAIYKLLAQGNAISAVTAETLLNSDSGGGSAGGFHDSDIPDL